MQDSLQQELADLEQDELNDRLMGDHVPVHHPAGPSRIEDSALLFLIAHPCQRTHRLTHADRHAVEDDEDAQLKELQAALAM